MEKITHLVVGDPSKDDCENCEICKGMKKAEEEGRELGYEELMGLFDRQNNVNNR